MKPPTPQPSQAELQQQREAIRRGLLRANTAAVAVLLVVIGFALAAIWQTHRVDKERARATAAEREGRDNLWQSYLAQARASRANLKAGHRFDSLEALAKAAAMRPSVELRNEAIACLTLIDLRLLDLPFARHRTNVSVDPDFERYAFRQADGRVQVRRIADDQLLSELPSQGSPVDWVHYFSPDARFLPVRYRDGQLKVWDVGRREVILAVATASQFYGVDISQDGRRLAVVDATGSIHVYELASATLLNRHTPMRGVWRVRFSPDGRRLAVCSDNGSVAKLIDAEDGSVLAELPHAAGVRNLCWSPNNQLVVTACEEGPIYLWKIGNPKPVFVLDAHQGAAIEVDFHPSGEFFATAGWDGMIRLWDVATGEPLLILPATGNQLRFSRDGRRLTFFWEREQELFACEVAGDRACRLLRKSTLTQADNAASSNAQSSVAFSPDEKFLASGHLDGFRLWDAKTRRELAYVPGQRVWSVLFDPAGKVLFTSGHDGFLRWPLEALLANDKTNGFRPEKITGNVCTRAAITTKGEIAYISNGNVQLHPSGKALQAMSGSSFVAFSRDARWLAESAWYRQGGRLWDWRSGRRIRDFAQGLSVDVGFSPDSRHLILCEPENYSFWKVETGELIRRIGRTNTAALGGNLAFTADGRMMACMRSRTQIELLDAETFDVLGLLEIPAPQMVAALAFNSSGTQLAAATSTPYIQLWDLQTLRTSLARLGLDWGGKPFDSDPGKSSGMSVASAPSVIRTSTLSLQRWSAVVALGGVVLAIALGLSILNRQRKLVESHRQIDELAMQRSEQLEQARDELLHNEKMKALGTLAAGIAHDFNNLLSVIRMGNTLASRRTTSQEDLVESRAAIERAVQQGKTVVRSMLGYSRDNGEIENYSLVKLVEETMSLLSKQFLSGLTVTLELDPRTPPVSGARGRLEQILLNLVVNASEAMAGRGQLRISARSAGMLGDSLVVRPRTADRYVELVVADSGPGIPAEVLPRVFEPFFSTKSAGTTPGTGLGLSVVYSLAQKDGLGLSLQSAPGVGTIFRVLIPVDEMDVHEIRTE